ncbi:DIS3-like exonuclease 2 [Sabethes cyaneus]|uniref:DIS3-like exonuclease 2 n=1 Tax=Sabethes cyaneus TaxID=53552 RepID=UPI00237D8498|nr:DIS3-like exonuclease 2 [Sabethes cyaneus]
MSQEDIFRKVREEIKISTSNMLANTKPSSDPLTDDTPNDRASPSVSNAYEPAGGFEFVSLDSSNRPEASQETRKARNHYNSQTLKKEISKKLENIKHQLNVRKEQCRKLDIENKGILTLPMAKSDGNTGEKSGAKGSNKNGAQPARSVEEPNHAKSSSKSSSSDLSEKIPAVLDKIAEIKLKMSSQAGPSNIGNAVNTNGSTSNLSTVSTGSNRKKQKKNKNAAGKTSSESTNATATSKKVVTEHDSLLLTLLALKPKTRDKYLQKLGKARGLLLPDKPGCIDPTFASHADDLKSNAINYCFGPQSKAIEKEDIRRPFLEVVDSEKIQSTRKVVERRTFEDEVSYLLNNGKITDVKDYKKELTLQNVCKAETNGFLDEKNRAALDELVERLVSEDVGYIVEGVLRVNMNNNAQAFVDDHTREADVFIHSILLRKCAMDGDFVKVFVRHGEVSAKLDASPKGSGSPNNDAEGINGDDIQLPEFVEQERPKNNWGFVVDILEKRHSRLCVGTFLPFAPNGGQFVKFMPRDHRIPMMRIYKQNWPEALFKNQFSEIESVIYQAEIINWKNDVPIGNVLKSIGKCGDLDVETCAILVEYDLDVTPYSEEIIKSLPTAPFQIPAEEIERRTDLREECVFTIDPLTARDLDDALSCKVLKNGNFEIGVHISDVSYFLKEGSELDELVKLRATSIYMVDNVYHMLPKPLCFLCSLLPGEDKMAFSVFWEITPKAKIVKTRFAKTIINSCAQLAYEHAQIMLENPNEDLKLEDFPKILHDYTPNFLSRIVNQLQSIALQLRANRMENGCLKINQPKLTFTLDPKSGKPTAFATYQLRSANQMIEDFMLLANSSVAEFCRSKFSDRSILRNHVSPSAIQMNNLAKMLARHGYTMEVDSSKSVAQSIESIIAACPQPDAARTALNVMIAKPMTRAQYFCSGFASTDEEFYHYALAIPIYTHFTSPIRRYADCMVHRVLAAALELQKPPTRTSEELSKLTGVCNVKKYNAKLAGDASCLLYFKHYMRTVKTLNMEAAVLDIAQHHMDLVLITTGHMLRTNYKRIAKGTEIEVIEKSKNVRNCILKNKNMPPVTIQLFSKVLVKVELVKDAITITSVLPATDLSVTPTPDETKDTNSSAPCTNPDPPSNDQ